MSPLSQRSLLAIAAVVDIALHARPSPVAAKLLAARHDLPPRRFETLLQSLVRAGILKGVRGPRGGYELARERRRISAGDIVRAALADQSEEQGSPAPRSALIDGVIAPRLAVATEAYLTALDAISVEDLSRAAAEAAKREPAEADFTI